MDFVTMRKDNKKLDRNELEKLSKTELIEKVMRLEAHNVQLKNIISKNVGVSNHEHKKKKQFDFSRVSFRHVFLKLYYLGWDYQGFATQEDTINTIEHHLFQALQMTCLIKDRESSNYHRCGRTDKGVSSFNQVISIDLRSKFPKSEQDNHINDEINYCKILNGVLPSTIQCICWSPVQDGYSARFDCKSRTYKYFFPKGNLNIDNNAKEILLRIHADCKNFTICYLVMRTALQYLIGTHDFRNFCKMDVANGVVTFIRNIMLAEINPCPDSAVNSPYEMYQLTLKGQAFLWHQVRCIVAVLLLIGENKESPEVIKELLDVEKNPRKPNYNLASEIPLNLFYCNYEGTENWIFDYTALHEVISGLQKMWTISCVKTTMMKMMLEELEGEYKKGEYDSNKLYSSLTSCLLQGVKSKVYNPLMERPKCEALEDRIQHYVKKRRLVVTDDKHEDEEVMENK